MKILLTFLLSLILFLTLEQTATAGDSDINVLSYYAVGNSLDGQPLIDRINVLRFFPVFAMRDSVQYAKVTVYYGGNIYARYATRMENGEYWEVLLPQFRLGEAIQRIEVETHIHLQQTLLIRTFKEVRDIHARNKEAFFQSMKGLMDNITTVKNTTNNDIDKISKNLTVNIKSQTEKIDSTLGERVKDIEAITVYPTITSYININNINKKIQDTIGSILREYTGLYGQAFDNFTTKLRADSCLNDTCYNKIPFTPPAISSGNIDLTGDVITISQTAHDQAKNVLDAIRQQVNNLINAIPTFNFQLQDLKTQISLLNTTQIDTTGIKAVFESLHGLQDSLYAQILHSVEANLVDTNYSGPSVRRSDILLDNDLKSATILYRNYKTALRHLPALDPAERLGVFRARYIPFAVTGNKLRRPLSEKSQAIFEVGLAFGDAIVTGDDFVVEEFSPRRLGIAFAITDKLFATDAEVLALALTYDFNSYGSIAFGANFRTSEVSQRRIVERYISFGINKRAFEVLIGQLKLLFL